MGYAASLERIEDSEAGVDVERRLVYGGTEPQDRGDTRVVPWNRMLELDWTSQSGR